MADKDSHTLEAQVATREDVKANVEADRQLEHELTLRQIFKHHKMLVVWCFYWAMPAIGWGFDSLVNGNVLSIASFRRDFGYVYDGQYVLPADWQVAFNTATNIGQFFGGFLCSYIADKMGRKTGLAIGIAIAAGGIFGEMFAYQNAPFLISKLILGVGLGFYLTLAPLAASEIAPVALRGIATGGVNLGIALGQLLSNSVVKGFGEREDRWAYRGPFATQLFFCVLIFFLPFAPESPWYLARNGKRKEALKTLRQLYGPDIDAESKLIALENAIENEESAGMSTAALFKCWKGTDRLRTMISTGVFFCQHFIGISFVLGFSTYFFQLAGLPTSKSFDMGVGVTACGCAGNICSWFVVNSFGRRKIFLFGMYFLTVLLLIIGILDVVPTGAAKWAQAALTVFYSFSYFATIGCMAFVLLGEASSTSLRAPTIAWATATQAVMGIFMGIVIPYMVNPDQANLRGKVGFIFGGLGALAAVWSWFYIPELKGKTFDEIDDLFQSRIPPRKMA